MLWLMLMLVLRKALKTGWWQQTAWQQLFTEQPPHNLWMFGRSLGLACLGSCRQHCFLNICRYIYWLNWQILYLSIWPVHLKILREQCCLGSWVFFVKSTQNSGPLCLWQRLGEFFKQLLLNSRKVVCLSSSIGSGYIKQFYETYLGGIQYSFFMEGSFDPP